MVCEGFIIGLRVYELSDSLPGFQWVSKGREGRKGFKRGIRGFSGFSSLRESERFLKPLSRVGKGLSIWFRMEARNGPT